MTPPSIHNIVLACPGDDYEQYLREARSLAEFYCGLLGMKILREDWFKIGTEPDVFPQLAFGDGPGEYRPPQWPDPQHPQHMHLDIAVREIDAAHRLVIEAGAAVLAEHEHYRVFADPAGHPFCLYVDDLADRAAGPGVVTHVTIDCFSPRALAAFYSELLDMPERTTDEPSPVVIRRTDGSLPMLAFQHSQHEPPGWPDPAYPQQVHMDIYFDDAPAARELAERLGAIPLPAMGGSCPVYADPAAHPFCLCSPGR